MYSKSDHCNSCNEPSVVRNQGINILIPRKNAYFYKISLLSNTEIKPYIRISKYGGKICKSQIITS